MPCETLNKPPKLNSFQKKRKTLAPATGSQSSSALLQPLAPLDASRFPSSLAAHGQRPIQSRIAGLHECGEKAMNARLAAFATAIVVVLGLKAAQAQTPGDDTSRLREEIQRVEAQIKEL